MNMSSRQWDSLCLLIEEGWPGEFTDGQATAWRVFLDDYDVEEVFVAIRALVAKGGKFRPSIAEVVGEIRRDVSAPTFDESWQLMRTVFAARTRVRKACWEPGERDALNERAMLDRSEQPDIHPLVASFVVRQGGPSRLRALGLDDPANDFREARRHELRQRWEEHCDAMDGRNVAILASRRGRGLSAFDPLAAINVSHAELDRSMSGDA